MNAALRRATASLRATVARETALAQTPAAPAPTLASTPTAAPRRPRLDALADRLRAGTAACPTTATATNPRGLLRAWAQGP